MEAEKIVFLKLKDQDYAFVVRDVIKGEQMTSFTRIRKDGTTEEWSVANNEIAFIQTKSVKKDEA